MRGAIVRCVGALALSSTFFIVAGCKHDPRIEQRSVFVVSPIDCPVLQNDAFSVIYAGGDFEPSLERPPTASVFLRDIGQMMPDLPKATRSLVVDVSQGDGDWRGLADIPAKGPINVLVWPGGQSCHLTRDVERRSDMALGVFGRHFMVAGGRSVTSRQVPHTYVGDLTTGTINRLAFGLKTRRAHASITPFPTSHDTSDAISALVAGGEDPNTGAALGTAEIYMPSPGAPNDVGDFDGERIELSEPRTRHASVVLANGETLLVGGVDSHGLALQTMEIVDPVTRRARTAGVALLGIARAEPTVLRLASGEILVAGGFAEGDNGGAYVVPTLEWFSPDASHPTKRSVDLVTGHRRAMVPLEAGGALAVILPDPGTPNIADFPTVWVISADGSLDRGLPVDPTTLTTVRLFEGAEGAPLLWTGKQWMRWYPWFGAFQTVAESPKTGPTNEAMANGDPGLALWLEDDGEAGMKATGFRFATRTRFDAVPKPLLINGPEQLAPDRLPNETSIRFEAESGLVLGPGASAFLTDVTFADFDLDLDVTKAAPTVVVRLETGVELEVGGAGCAFAQTVRRRLSIRRRARHIDVRVDGAPYRSCPTELEANGRVSVGLRGAQGAGISAARNLVVTRH